MIPTQETNLGSRVSTTSRTSSSLRSYEMVVVSVDLGLEGTRSSQGEGVKGDHDRRTTYDDSLRPGDETLRSLVVVPLRYGRCVFLDVRGLE